MSKPFRWKYDRKAKMGYLWCDWGRKGLTPAFTTKPVHEKVSLDLGPDGELLGIEVFET